MTIKEPRNIVSVIANILYVANGRNTQQSGYLISKFTELKETAEYVPPECQSQLWETGVGILRAAIPPDEIKRTGWQREVMRIWNPVAFTEGGAFYVGRCTCLECVGCERGHGSCSCKVNPECPRHGKNGVE